TPQTTSSPFSPGTMTSIHVCGFCQRNSFTVPVRVTCLVRSKAAGEWWATSGETNPQARATNTAARIRRRPQRPLPVRDPAAAELLVVMFGSHGTIPLFMSRLFMSGPSGESGAARHESGDYGVARSRLQVTGGHTR